MGREYLRARARIACGTVVAAVTTLGLGAAPAMAGKPGGGGGGTSGTPTTYSGSAYNLKATVNPLNVLPTKIGPVTYSALPADGSGGIAQDSLLDLNGIVTTPLLVSADALSTSAVGSGSLSSSFSSVADVALGVPGALGIPGLTMSVSVIQTEADAVCTNGVASTSGSSEILSLTVNGTKYGLSGSLPPNITIPGVVSINLNEQVVTGSGGSKSISVNAIHITTLSPLATLVPADIILGHSDAGITCASGSNPPPPPCGVQDFVTGGGHVGGWAFGFVGGLKPNGLSGHFNAKNVSGNGDHLQGTPVTGYGVGPDPTYSRVINYAAKLNGVSLANGLTLTVADYGEPGTNDKAGWTAGSDNVSYQVISEGNIQLHPVHGCDSLESTSTGGGGHHK